jgi:hypothetical protein
MINVKKFLEKLGGPNEINNLEALLKEQKINILDSN